VEIFERAVVHDPPLVDHDQAAAQPLDVGEVVGRQYDRGVAGGAERGEECAHGLLAHDRKGKRTGTAWARVQPRW
jgi:hypothetical protein